MEKINTNRDLNSFPKFKRSKKLSGAPINDFAFPIYVQRRSNMGVTIICPDMNIARSLPLPHQYETVQDFYHDLMVIMIEVDRLAMEEFKKRDHHTKKKHREKLFPRGLKEHLEIDIQNLRFKPPQAAELTTKSLRTWQRWCSERSIKRKTNGLKYQRRHYSIPFSEIEPFLKSKYIEDPRLLLTYLDS